MTSESRREPSFPDSGGAIPAHRRALFLSVILGVLAVFFFGAAPLALAQTTDYDSDNDGLIEVSTPGQLYAIRFDADGGRYGLRRRIMGRLLLQAIYQHAGRQGHGLSGDGLHRLRAGQ